MYTRYLKIVLVKSIVIFVVWFSLTGWQLVVAQNLPGKHITEKDYDKWGTLWSKGLSKPGNWMSYEINYDYQPDTLFVQSTTFAKTYILPKGTDGQFGDEVYYACLMPEDKLQLLDLATGNIKVIPNVKRFDLVNRGKYIIALDKWYGEKSVLNIYTEDGILLDSVEGVTEYKLNEKMDALLFVSRKARYEIGIISFSKYQKQVLSSSSSGKFHQLCWQNNGHSVAYLGEMDSVSKVQVVNFYNLDKHKAYTFEQTKVGSFQGSISKSDRFPLIIADDGKFVTVPMVMDKQEILRDKNAAEVWNGNDKKLFPATQLSSSNSGQLIYIRWDPESGEYNQITSESLPRIFLNKNMTYALISNIDAYVSLPSYYPKTDYYLKDISTGETRLILKQQDSDPNQITFNPKGDKVVFYKHKSWWIYDIKQKTHFNITKAIDAVWDSHGDNAPSQFSAFGIAGWLNDERSILLYDKYDLWKVAIDGSKYSRLTKGLEKQIVYRIAGAEYKEVRGNDLIRPSFNFDLNKDILLNVLNLDDWSTGYALYNIKQGVSLLAYGAQKYGEIEKGKAGFVYTSQKFNEPPKLEFIVGLNKSPKLLYQSNKHQQDYLYGKAQLIRYKNANGDSLKATIFYPAGYDVSKKYPMIVEIYETKSKEINQYCNPSLLNRTGFNISNYTLNGYIVLLPDIHYKLGDPAVSAADCIISAVKAVVAKGIVAHGKIGLIGHSYGGYETNYVITQTGLFAAAVSGAGISDEIGFYFNVGENHGMLPDMWRFESQQFRMGKSLYNDKAAYLRNSPIMSADKISTPLLLWTGKRDRVVPMTQSVTMYLALRRLGKKSILLAYPNEDHNLSRPENKINLTKRIENWFDYYLKGEKSVDWIAKGTAPIEN